METRKEKPIIFSTAMVQAILDGRKTQTRRVAKVPNDARYERGGLVWYDTEQAQDAKRCPKYQPGDILWVRETWTTDPHGVDRLAIANGTMSVYYRADYTKRESDDLFQGVWCPSIHMPREAARIFLRVKDVRVERVREISSEDAIAEGCEGVPCDHMGCYACEDCMNTGWREPPQVEFMQLWDSINAKRGYSWESNPFVWVIEFERTEKQKDPDTPVFGEEY